MAFVIPIAGTVDQFIVSAGPELGIVQWDGISKNVTYTPWAQIGDNVYRANEGKVSPSGSLFVGTYIGTFWFGDVISAVILDRA